MGNTPSRRTRRKKFDGFGAQVYPKFDMASTPDPLRRDLASKEWGEEQCKSGVHVNKMFSRIRNVIKDIDQEIEAWNREYQAFQESSKTGSEPQLEAVQTILAHKDRCESIKFALLQSSLQLKASKTKRVLTEGLGLIHEVLTDFSDDSTLKCINALTWEVEKKQAENRFKEELQEWMIMKTAGGLPQNAHGGGLTPTTAGDDSATPISADMCGLASDGRWTLLEEDVCRIPGIGPHGTSDNDTA